MNVLIIGRCRTIGDWMGGLFIGTLQYPGVEVTDTRFEGIRVTIFNKTIFNPWVSRPGLINALVFMHDAKGIFFFGCWQQYIARLIPPIVFVHCHVDEVWVRFS